MRPSNAALNKQSQTNGEHGTEDAADQQTTKEKQEAMDADPRMVFGETEFKNVREKYKMPKHVGPLSLEIRIDQIDSSTMSWITRL